MGESPRGRKHFIYNEDNHEAIVEIRSLNIKPGKREEFHRLYIEQALPLLKRWDFDVVAHGPSLHDGNTYYVIRRFDSLAQREQSEDAFYNSDDWRQGPREALNGSLRVTDERMSFGWVRVHAGGWSTDSVTDSRTRADAVWLDECPCGREDLLLTNP